MIIELAAAHKSSVMMSNMSRKEGCGWIWIAALMVVVAARANAQVSCIQAITSLMPCQSFLVGTSGGVAVPCCEGVGSLSQLVGSDRAEIRSLCTCFKQATAVMGANSDRVKQLPSLCNVAVPVPIDPNVNCDSLYGRWMR